MHQIQRATIISIALLAILSPASLQAKELNFKQITYPNNQRQNYPIVLLDLALRASGETIILTPSHNTYEQKQALIDLAANKNLDISWSMTSADRESMLLPVRIPIFKGLIGWRIPLVHQDKQSLFAENKSLESIQPLKSGQMHDWPDTPILEWNGMTVFRSSTYEGLFKMLSMQRIDYFPRSVIEVWREHDENPDMQIQVDENILIYYPTAFYYFVNKNRPDLAAAVTKGLEALIKDGRFDALFMHYHHDFIEKADLNSRTILTLKNPLLPPKTPLDRSELWYKPEDFIENKTAPATNH